jgi:hypothetical protein
VTSQAHKVAFYADIFYRSELSPAYWIPPTQLDVEAILLGGDIHYLPDQLGLMLKEIRQTQLDTTTIIVVPGNGEYIDQELSESRQQYRAEVESVANTVFLDDQMVTLPSGLRVIGSTLWSLVAEDQIDRYTKMLTDHGLKGVDNIRTGDRYLALKDTNDLHLRARSYIESELRGMSDAERRNTIVCTHFWPTLRPWTGNGDGGEDASPSTPESDWSQMIGSDLDPLIADCGPRFWLCGHAHRTKHVTIGATEVSSNPRAGDGPGHINPDFLEHYIVEV